MVKKVLTRKDKLKKLDWQKILANPLRVLIYPAVGYLLTLPVEAWSPIDLSDQQKVYVIMVLSALQSLIYNATKDYKEI
jgi:hypothetical protein